MKKIKIKPIIICIFLISFQSIFYLLSKIIQGEANLLNNFIDDKIPFIIYFIIPYCIWYLMLFLVPYLLYLKDKNNFIRYTLSFIFLVIISNIIFIAYPTTVIRPEVSNDTILGLLTNFIYDMDTPALNCLPSLHCGISMLWILCTFNNSKLKKYEYLIISIISIIIMLSTLFIKQHVIIDLLLGNIISTIIYIIVIKIKKVNLKTKKLLKI